MRAVPVQLVVDLVLAALRVVCFLQTLYGSGPFFHLLLRLLALVEVQRMLPIVLQVHRKVMM
jgi:hypothetical protein